MTTLREVEFTVGARLPSLSAVLRDGATGTPKDLSDFAGVKFRMVSMADGQTKVDDADAVIVDAKNGIVRYDWSAGDVDTAGRFHAWFIMVDGDGLKEFFPVGRRLVIEFFEA